jgi:2'-5' RNA ligase
MPKNTSTARLFIAADLPEHVRERLVSWARAAVGGQGVFARRSAMPRLLAPESMHLTLSFLGERPVAEIDPLAHALDECPREGFELRLGAPLWLPPRRPSVLAVEVSDTTGALRALKEAAVGAVEAVCDPPPPDPSARRRGIPRSRRFRPHVTVARVRGRAMPRERALAPTPALGFAPPALVLYRSLLRPEGAAYEALHTIALDGPSPRERRSQAAALRAP